MQIPKYIQIQSYPKYKVRSFKVAVTELFATCNLIKTLALHTSKNGGNTFKKYCVQQYRTI